MAKYGSDKPDLRCGMPIQDLREVFRESSFEVFRKIVAEGGTVRGFVVPKASGYSRSAVDGIVNQAKAEGRRPLWARRSEDGTITSSFTRAVGEEAVRRLLDASDTHNGQLLFVVAGEPDGASKALGQFRSMLAKKDGLLDGETFAFTWVVDFPLLEWDAEEKRYVSMHHPFTSPLDDDIAKLDSDPGTARAKAYDLVLNGSEIGGGSIRIHDADTQRRIFSLLNISDEEAKLRFGFFLEALEYGTPPHGGIALGLDRIAAILGSESSIREVIAFPKTADRGGLDVGCSFGGRSETVTGIASQIRKCGRSENETLYEEDRATTSRSRDALRRARRQPQAHRVGSRRPDPHARRRTDRRRRAIRGTACRANLRSVGGSDRRRGTS